MNNAAVLFLSVAMACPVLVYGSGTTPPASTPASVSTAQKQYTPGERLALAKQCLAAGYKPNKDITKAQFGNINGAKTHLAVIKKDDKEYQEAQLLLKEVSRREQDVRRASVILLKQTQIDKRISTGKEIEQIFVKTGMDVYVTISGKEKDIITMTYVLWSRPLAYKYMNNDSFYSILKNTGFKKAIFYDKYNNTWTYTIKQ